MPENPFIRILYYMRLASMGLRRAVSILRLERNTLERYFVSVEKMRAPTGRSKITESRGEYIKWNRKREKISRSNSKRRSQIDQRIQFIPGRIEAEQFQIARDPGIIQYKVEWGQHVFQKLSKSAMRNLRRSHSYFFSASTNDWLTSTLELAQIKIVSSSE